MRTKFPICWLLAACLLLPLASRAQSPKSSDVVSVRELSIPPRALRAYSQGAQLLSKKEAARSLPFFQKAIDEFEGYYEAYYEMGVADVILSRMTDAEQSLRKSVDLSGGQFAPSLIAVGAILVSQKKFAEAEEVTRQGLNLDPTSWKGHYTLAWALLGLNRLDEAEMNARDAVRAKSDSLEALRLLADIHGEQKDYSGLVTDLDAYVKLDPGSPTGMKAKVLRESALRLLNETQSASAIP